MEQELEALVRRDAAFCRTMAGEMEDYLKSNVLFWEPSQRDPTGVDLPKLTIGGLLLSQRRLETLRGMLTSSQLEALDASDKVLTFQEKEWRNRLGSKLSRELRSRLDSWSWYLDDFEEHPDAAVAHYAHQIETRVKIELLLQEADEIELAVEEARQRLNGLDGHLRSNFASDDFLWPDPLAEGFPQDRFWYLWGRAEAKENQVGSP
jgi:hypothetical protein